MSIAADERCEGKCTFDGKIVDDLHPDWDIEPEPDGSGEESDPDAGGDGDDGGWGQGYDDPHAGDDGSGDGGGWGEDYDDPGPDEDDQSYPDPDYPDPPPPDDEREPLEPHDPSHPSAGELRSMAEASRQRALNSLDRARAALERYVSGGGTRAERAAVEATVEHYFPGGATPETMAAIAETIGEARDFLAGARFHGIASSSDVEAVPEHAGRGFAELGYRNGAAATTYFAGNTIFIYESYASFGAADRASILTHEGFHGAPEPSGPYHGTPRVDHRESGGGPLDTAYNYQGLTAELAGLPISMRMRGDIASFRSR